MIPEIPVKPEQTFFDDPALDRIMSFTMALAGEVYVLRDRQRVLETLLEEHGVVQREQLDTWQPSAEEHQTLVAERDAFVASLMDNLIGMQKSKSVG